MSDKDDPYLDPETGVLRNRFGIKNGEQLDRIERENSFRRMLQDAPSGDFDLKHLQAIHRHLFQDVYEWAGQIRTVEISKGGSAFMFRQYMERGMTDVHRRARDQNYLVGTTQDQFAEVAAQIMGDVNYVHPFREGNGRTQLLYLKQLTERAGHKIALDRLQPKQWLDASIRAHNSDYASMAKAIRSALVDREHEKTRSTDLPDAVERLEAVRNVLAKPRSKSREDRER